jgi:hypothetical protein
MKYQIVAVAGVVALAAGLLVCSHSFKRLPSARMTTVYAAQTLPITIGSAVPSELNPTGGGAPAATMQQAAVFAWQEFIALNWPAVPQTGKPKTRDYPDNNCNFSDPKCTGRPLVWETFRQKVEIFPGQNPTSPTTQPPPGYPGVVPNDPSLGYDAHPQYNYYPAVPACDVPPDSQVVLPTPWVNLDETDQITLDSMFAGVAPTSVEGNSSPQMIRFLAKANRKEYVYVVQKPTQWWAGVPSGIQTATLNYLNQYQKSPTSGSTNVVSLPDGTIEVKAAWRELTPKELTKGHYTTATARFYELKNGNTCYRQHTFGLVALHIIQKTPTAPYFIYATFEQADNILRPDGLPVEDADGNINPPLPSCRSGQTAPCPTTPSVTLDDTSVINPDMSGVPPQVNLVPPSAQYCTASTGTTPVNRLYYINSQGLPALPTGGFICVNYRDETIPQPIIDANQTAHAAITAYNAAHQIPKSPWLFYKLVNVQYEPIDKNYAGVYQGNDPNSGHNPSSYHQANIVVETNRTLQLFSGGLVQSGGTGANSDYQSQFSGTPGTAIHKNMYYGGSQQNMGGCMGCHGSQGQHQAGDFSVILAKGSVQFPETPAAVGSAGAKPVPRNRSLAFHLNK